MNIQRWQDWGNVFLGAWLSTSPWLLGYVGSPAATWNALIVGALVAVLAYFGLGGGPTWGEWVTFGLGVWAVLSPWILGFSGLGTPVWNVIIVGMLVALLALYAGRKPVRA
ncbi:MAG: SPW repeat protein [Meiothermus sp.]|nr:SPW repeat protein [Meiothermus sp.]